ncbi:hypothetical protein SELMODRAFT_403622 [Selaginella moellendorffii]|uniref:Peptidase A1 domain-containing protein n=1 Tax=Selaginella moellendorffii TaxID=88036 RepID=D8QS04_SELML|nr:hypothetical protein SELMODRAFT_403622 [Selaginella moellendorffii]
MLDNLEGTRQDTEQVALGPVSKVTCGSGVLKLKHRFSELEGSSKQSGKRGMSEEHFRQLMDHTRARSRRFLLEVDLMLNGSSTSDATYYAQIGVGHPVQFLNAIVDTGSDILWFKCKLCQGCSSKKNVIVCSSIIMQGPITLYDPELSITASPATCSDPLCSEGGSCRGNNNSCAYDISYEDTSSSTGIYFRDVVHLGHKASLNTTMFLGCATSISGLWPVDGIMGFGRSKVSVPNQLAAQAGSYNIFYHCLSGEKEGGGILVLGKNDEFPEMVYTPMLANDIVYNVKLVSLSVNSKALPIEASEFEYNATVGNGGTIIDSGTSSATFPSKALALFVKAVSKFTTAIPTAPLESSGSPCFISISDRNSVEVDFPNVTLKFDGGATMELTAHNYLEAVVSRKLSESTHFQGVRLVCISWSVGNSTILGDAILKDKVVVYDMEKSRIGWVKQDLSHGSDRFTPVGSKYKIGIDNVLSYITIQMLRDHVSTADSDIPGYSWYVLYALVF